MFVGVGRRVLFFFGLGFGIFLGRAALAAVFLELDALGVGAGDYDAAEWVDLAHEKPGEGLFIYRQNGRGRFNRQVGLIMLI
jgi:hypothetical protein